MSKKSHFINNLCLIKSNNSLYALKWNYESNNDDMIQFVIECKKEIESENCWRFYGRTTLLCFPILTHRLNYGSVYKFRVSMITRNNLIVGEKYVCDTLVKANDISGHEFSCIKLEESIIRELSTNSFADTQTIEEKNNDHYLKCFDSAFNEYDYKIWVPFKSSINPFYDKSKNYTEWTHQQKLVSKGDKDYEALKRMQTELLMALTHPKFDEYYYELAVHMNQLLYIIDDIFDSNTKIGYSVTQTRLLLSEFYYAMLGISDHITDSTQKNVAVKDSLIYFTKEYQLVADKHNMPLELMFDNLFHYCNIYVIESDSRHGFKTTDEDITENSMPELNHYFAIKNYNGGGVSFILNWNELLLNYKIPFEFRSHPEFIKTCVACSLQICISNDILGVKRDAKHGETHSNIVLILEKYSQMSRNDALRKSCQIHDSIVRQYLRAKQTLLELFKNHEFIEDLGAYVKGMEDWMSGHIEWMKITQRFTHSLTSHHEL